MLPDDVPTIWFSFGCLAVLVLSLWTVPYGHYAFTDGELIAEAVELLDEFSFLAQEIKNRLKQQQYKIILDIIFIMLPLVLSDCGRHTG
mgnify:CR=1 FL=1